jgi:hypothetical protein
MKGEVPSMIGKRENYVGLGYEKCQRQDYRRCKVVHRNRIVSLWFEGLRFFW